MAARLIHRGPSLAAGLILVAAFALVPGVANASGGGGCGQAVTDSTGTRVHIESFCFGPTITRVQPGAEVTFTNLDPVAHSVLGANGSWGGYDALKENRSVTYLFAEAGVYPYVCTFHIGMVGVVVVGDGIGGAIGNTTKDGPVTKVVVGSSPAANVVAAARLPGPSRVTAARFIEARRRLFTASAPRRSVGTPAVAATDALHRRALLQRNDGGADLYAVLCVRATLTAQRTSEPSIIAQMQSSRLADSRRGNHCGKAAIQFDVK